MRYAWYDLVGSIGVGIIILTYILLQLEKIKSETLIYSLLNACGAGLILISIYFDFNFSAFVVELFWLLISLFGMTRHFLRKNV